VLTDRYLSINNVVVNLFKEDMLKNKSLNGCNSLFY